MLAFGVLPLSFVCVLVAAEGLASREVSAAVMALESPAALAAIFAVALAYICGGVGVLVALFFFPVLRHIVVDRFRVVVGVDACPEFDAEEPNALFFVDWRSRADEGQLREGFNVHEVLGFPLNLLHEIRDEQRSLVFFSSV